MQSVSKVKSFFATHKAARVLLVIAAALLAFVLIFHPHGTKTYLITGIDNYGSLNDNGRSDVMMLVQVGFDSGKIHAVTFARDIVVPNEHNKNVKLNTIVRMQDEDALVDTLERVFDLKIDGWFRVNFSSVITIIDAMGGVQLELTDAEARYINGREGEYPDTRSKKVSAASTARNRSATRAAASWITTSAAATGRPSSSPRWCGRRRK